ncbi:MAG: Na+/H+ antiporter NhaA [Anaerovoracaceae bacterium]|jgi:NhaA family Na+:H+ antiporter
MENYLSAVDIGRIRKRINLLSGIREYSVPLIIGVLAALIAANLLPETYKYITTEFLFAGKFSASWLVENVFMVLFFGTAGIEIVKSLSPGGALNPIKKAVTPLMATVGGVLGPIAVFFILNSVFGNGEFSNGWGVCTATDIALAWLIAKVVFGAKHPAVSFLLLLAVADDGIGLGIIAVFYPTPGKPVRPVFLLLVLAGMAVAYLLNKKGVRSFWPYVIGGGILSWMGLFMTGVSPALALIAIIPFMPRGKINPEERLQHFEDAPQNSTLAKFEKKVGPIVDYGLFFFGFCMAGLQMTSISSLTLIVMFSLFIGKTVGISSFACLFGKGLKFGLPKGMDVKDVIVAGMVGGIGLTVALFVSQSAFIDPALQGAAKMGALLSILSGLIAIAVRRAMKAAAAGRAAAEEDEAEGEVA